ncbi:MAG: hypothetical protein M3014_09670 [Chloroflexota bacterium]|nr:hypothetical protein [Chloroflexota bacterium]
MTAREAVGEHFAQPEGASPLSRHPLTSLWAGRLLLAVMLALVLGLGLKTANTATTSVQMFSYPFQFDESEGMIVAETMLLDHGTGIYGNLTPDLFIAAPYPPLFYLLNLPFQHLLGSEPTFKPGRAISMLSTLFIALSIFGITRSLTGSRLGGLLGALAWLSFDLVLFWGSLVKPDMLALASGLGGLWWLASRPVDAGFRSFWWALPLFLAAFFTKQTGIAAGIAGTGWLLFMRPRLGVLFGTALAAGALLPSLLLNWLTAGGYFYHELTIHTLPWFPDRFFGYIGELIGTYGFLLIPGILVTLAAGACWLLTRRTPDRATIARQGGLLLLLYGITSFVVATFTGTLGGNHNHMLDWAASSCLGLGVGAAWLTGASWQPKLVASLLGLALLSQVPGLFSTPPWLKLELGLLADTKRADFQNVFQYVTNNGGPAYSDNVGLMLSTHKRLWTTDPFTQTHATHYGRWDQSKLLAEVQRKGFAQIILRIDVALEDTGAGDVSPEILQAVRDNYKLDQRNVENIYVPK